MNLKKLFVFLLATSALCSCEISVDAVSSIQEESSNLKESSSQSVSTFVIESSVEVSRSEEFSSELTSSEIKRFTVTFLNYDDTLLYQIDVNEGEEAVYGGETPTKPADDEFTYEFEGWDTDLSAIYDHTSTYAQFKAKANGDWGEIIWGE